MQLRWESLVALTSHEEGQKVFVTDRISGFQTVVRVQILLDALLLKLP
jgi:hypothetical protein